MRYSRIVSPYGLVFIAMLIATIFLAGACSEDQDNEGQENEQKQQQEVYNQLTEGQPAEGMSYSPSRDTANKWASTWEEQGKVSYVYIIDSVGGQLGYFIFKGLPVSYCASLTPPTKITDVDEVVGPSSVDAMAVPAPALDGMFYSAANCSQMYGFDALTDQYYEFTGSGAFGYFLSDQPIRGLDMEPLGETSIEEAEKN